MKSSVIPAWFAVFLVLGSLLLIDSAKAAEHTKDTLAVVKANIAQENAVLIDVREKVEWEQRRLEGALLVPLGDLQKGEDPKSINPAIDKKKILYTHCRAGRRSLLAAAILEKLGYDVRPLKQGTADLIKSGFPQAE